MAVVTQHGCFIRNHFDKQSFIRMYYAVALRLCYEAGFIKRSFWRKTTSNKKNPERKNHSNRLYMVLHGNN